jgi:2-hydroxychromene-2-carboxylate isomerase
MKPKVEFLFDYASPFSYLANLQIDGFAKRNGAAVSLNPKINQAARWSVTRS